MYQGYGQDDVPTAQHSTKRRGSHHGRTAAGIAAAGVLAGGVAFAAVSLTGGDAPAAAAAGPTGQAAVLNDALTAASAPASSATAAGTAPAGTTGAARWPLLRNPLVRLRLLGGMDGQFTFETRTGPRTLAFERGTIQSVSGGDVVIRARDGLTWTWEIVSDSVVRDSGRKSTVSALSAGQLVFVGGPVVDGARDARLIVIRTPAATSTPSAPSGSAGS